MPFLLQRNLARRPVTREIKEYFRLLPHKHLIFLFFKVGPHNRLHMMLAPSRFRPPPGERLDSADRAVPFAFNRRFMLSGAPINAAMPRRQTGECMTVALIVAAGRGHRLGGPMPKQYRALDGVPIIRRTIEALRRHQSIRAVKVVINPADLTLYEAATTGLELSAPINGGSSRQESVRNGLEGIASLRPEMVLIHDAVRPFVEPNVIGAVIDALGRVPGAVVGVPLTDTLKRCDDGLVAGTIDRANLWRAQTPQGFRYAAIVEAHRQVCRGDTATQEFTDDCAVAEKAGLAIEMVPGSEDNFKITTESDLARAEALLRQRAEMPA